MLARNKTYEGDTKLDVYPLVLSHLHNHHAPYILDSEAAESANHFKIDLGSGQQEKRLQKSSPTKVQEITWPPEA